MKDKEEWSVEMAPTYPLWVGDVVWVLVSDGAGWHGAAGWSVAVVEQVGRFGVSAGYGRRADFGRVLQIAFLFHLTPHGRIPVVLYGVIGSGDDY